MRQVTTMTTYPLGIRVFIQSSIRCDKGGHSQREAAVLSASEDLRGDVEFGLDGNHIKIR